MAVAVYSIPELTLISDATTTTNWAEPSLTDTQGGAATAETDYFIQGTGCISKSMGPSGTGTGGLLYNAGSGLTIPSPGAYFLWFFFGAPNGMDTFALEGTCICIGSALNAYNKWKVLGSDTYTYGGWKCIPVDPTVSPDGVAIGSPSATLQYFGAVTNLAQAVTKGNPWALDISRYGRGTLQIVSGDATAYGTFPDAAATDQNTTNRWGLCQLIDGTFVMQGHFLMGVAATAVDFRDSGRSIVIANTLKVNSGFNLFEIRNASSRVDWSACNFLALGTVSRGNFLVTNNADVNIDACSFTDMGTFTLLAATAITNSTLRSCDTITAPGSDLRGTSVLTSRVAADAGAVIWNVATDPNGLLDNMTFSKGTNAHHAIDFGTSVTGNITLSGIEFTGFGSTGDSNDSTVRFLATGGSLTLTLVGCTVNGAAATASNFSIDDAAGIAVTLSIDPVTILVNVKDNDGANLPSARVFLQASDGTGDLPFNASVTSIARDAGTTATVTHATAHGLNTGEYVKLSGITNDSADNAGAHQITKTGATTYTFASVNSGTLTYTGGTITATGALIYGLTAAVTGNISSSSRAISVGQPMEGFVRKSSATPRFKTFPLAQTIDSATALTTINVRLVLDE